ncbi:MAG: hypothetical protein IAC87_06870 [Muribaculum sp.]|uniref:Uncharacterized protein n=2 Tax=Muribaculaceae TaxID=2005473 RepID=A0A9D9J308_9BACT|nr:hypothetical protein [Candidatus Merdivivens faecigallinarum]
MEKYLDFPVKIFANITGMPTFAAFLRQNMPECGQIWLLATTVKNAKTGDVRDERTSSCEKDFQAALFLR